jgi:hypothetical protein
MEPYRLTESEARNVLDQFGLSISRKLNNLYDEAMAFSVPDDGLGAPEVATHAYNAWELSQQDVDDRLMVPVGELRDGDATATLMIGINDGIMEVVYR